MGDGVENGTEEKMLVDGAKEEVGRRVWRIGEDASGRRSRRRWETVWRMEWRKVASRRRSRRR
jgi:hypothetical protein